MHYICGINQNEMNQVESDTYNFVTNGNQYSGNVGRLYDSLQALSELKQGWDGYNALPVNQQVINNMYVVLNNCDNSLLQDWSVYPEINGTILLQNHNRRAGINLGDKTFSYFIVNGNSVDGDDDKLFTVSLFLNVLNKLNDRLS